MESEAPSYHAVIGDVDIKAKMVAVGCPGEAVAVHCSRQGRHMPWNAEAELQAREVLSWVTARFAATDYKLIPVPAPQGIGLKIHPVKQQYTNGNGGTQANEVTLEIFEAVKGVIEHNINGERVFLRQRGNKPGDQGRLCDHALKREIERILRTAGHVETKVRDIVRLIGAH